MGPRISQPEPGLNGMAWGVEMNHKIMRTVGVGTLAAVALVLGASAPTSAGASTAPVALSGAGSTFDAPFFSVAFARYHQAHPGVSVGYSAVGSGTGITRFSGKQVNFGATDAPMTPGQQATALGGTSVQVPVALGAEVVVFNLDAPTAVRLNLTGPVVARIFLGQIANWRDPAIAALNPRVDLPDQEINVVHRSDSSGTTYIFSNYLASVDSAWASKVGIGKALAWPVGVGAQGNPGVATAVAQTPYSIGYVERSYSAGPLLDFAAIRNRAGRYSVPYAASIAAAAAQKPNISPTNFSIVNEPGSNSYPICGYSWALLYVHQPNQNTGITLVNLIEWLTHEGQSYAAPIGYVALPKNIQALARSTLDKVVGPSGVQLLN
jgi:phosphate transport system substrate-binding protein